MLLGYFTHDKKKGKMSTPLTPYPSKLLTGFKCFDDSLSESWTWVYRPEMSEKELIIQYGEEVSGLWQLW